MISIYHWNGTTKEGRWQETACLPNVVATELPDNDIFWIDLEDPSTDEEEYVFGKFFPIHPLTKEDITKPKREPDQGVHFPKVEEFVDYLFVIVNPLSPQFLEKQQKLKRASSKIVRVQLSAIMTRTVLVTHHYQALPNINQVKQGLFLHCEHAARGPDYLFHLVLDAMVDEYAPMIDRLADRLERIETQLFRKLTPDLIKRLLVLKRMIIAFRKTLILEREVLFRLTRGEFRLVDDREIAYYRNVFDHLVRYTELIEGAREMVSDLMQTHLAAMSNKLNGIMKVLAMVSTIILPMSLVAGIYGMNFKHNFPELEWEYGYPFALGLMVLVAAISVGIFYWKKWF